MDPSISIKRNRIRYGWDLMFSCLLRFGEENGHYNGKSQHITHIYNEIILFTV